MKTTWRNSGTGALCVTSATVGLTSARGLAPDGPEARQARVSGAASLPGSAPSAVADASLRDSLGVEIIAGCC